MAYFSFSRLREGGLWAARFALLAAFGPALSAQTSIPSANDGFNPKVTGIVYALVTQADGRILVGGQFTSLQPNGASGPTLRGNLARLNADGTLDTTFDPEPNLEVMAIALQPNGQILIGGYFTTLQPNRTGSAVTRNHIARLNPDGSIDTTFDPNAQGSYTGEVNSITVQTNGQILIGGAFTSMQPNGASSPTAIAHLARLNANGTLDTTFNPDPNALVETIFEESNGQILIGGTFTTVQPNGAATAAPEPYLARLNNDGTLDATFNPIPNGDVTSIAIQADGQILIAGHFTTLDPNAAVNSINVDYIARLNPDGTRDSSFLTNSAGAINTMALQADGKIVIGGTIGQITNGANSILTTFEANYLARINSDGSPDQSFIPNPNYTVYALTVQADGQILVGGQFTQLQPPGALVATQRAGLARLNLDGTLDTDFNPNAFGGIGAVAAQANGQVVIGGIFNSVNGSSHVNLARLNVDGTVDNTFTPSTNGTVETIVIQADGKILIGGNFTLVSGVNLTYMARLNTDGSVDTSYYPDPNNEVKDLVLQPNGELLVAGAFSGFNPNVAVTGYVDTINVDGVARLTTSGTVDLTFQPNPNATVYSVIYQPSTTAGQDDAVIIAGAFGAVSPVDTVHGTVTVTNTPYMARLDAVNGLADATYSTSTQVATANFYPNPNGQVNGMALQPDGKILICGAFTSLQPNPTTSTQVINGVVTTVTTPFTQCYSLARLNPTGSLDTTFSPQANGVALAITVNPTNGQILVGGLFTSISGLTRNYIARLNTDGSVDSAFSAGANASVESVQYLSNNQFIAAGGFTSILPSGSATPTAANHIARFNADGSLDTTFLPTLQTTGQISSVIVAPDNKIIIGGNFTSMMGIVATNIARFNQDTSQDTSFYANANGPVNAMVSEEDGTYMIGGAFTAIGHGYANYLARINPDSTLNTLPLAAPDGPVKAVVAHTNAPTVIGGAFAHVGGAAVANLARIAASGSVDATFAPNPNAAVNAIAAQGNGQYVVGGAFTVIDGVARTYLARVNADGSLDTAFNPLANGTVSALVIQPDGKILVGGNFTSVGGAGRGYLARLNSDGSLDATFNPGANGAVATMVLQALPPGASVSAPAGSSTDQILVGGAFTSIAGGARNYLARLNYDGSLDATFNPAPDGAITALALGSDGKPVLAGAFANVGGLPRAGLARLGDTNGNTQSIAISTDASTVTWTSAGAPEYNEALFEISTDEISWVVLGYGTRVGTSNTWQLSGLQTLPSGSNFYLLALGETGTSQGDSTSTVQDVQEFNIYPPPVIASASSAAAVNGSPFYYEIAATHTPTSYAAAGLPAGLTMNPTTGVLSGTPTQTGTFNVTYSVTNAGGTTPGSLTLTIAAAPATGAVAPLARLINVSTRGGVDPTDPLIVGFAIAGPAPKTVLLRAVGTGLSSIIPGFGPLLTNPSLTLCNNSGQTVLTNTGWDGSSTLMQIFAQTGAFPLTVGSTDAAVVTTLSPGNYTVVVQQASGTAGTVLAEIYDADINPLAVTQRLINLSGRGAVNASNFVIGGFVIHGSVPKTVLIRAAGPALAAQGVTSPLAAPVLNIFGPGDVMIAQNAGWGTPTTINASYPAASASTIAADITTAGAYPFASGSADSAVVVTLPPGNYTGQISAAAGQTGTALFEIYELP